LQRKRSRSPRRWCAPIILITLIVGGTVALIAANATRWAGLMFAVTVVLVVADFLVARATSKFAWYGVAVFFSVLLFGAALKIARPFRDPVAQLVALLRKCDD